MDLIGAIGNGVGFIGSLQDSLKKEAERDAATISLGDTISISAEAKEKLKLQSAGETADKQQNSAGGNTGSGSGSAAGSSVAGAQGTSEEPADQIAELQKQIKKVQERLQKANERLQEAQAEQANVKRKKADDEAALLEDNESPEVKIIRAEIEGLNTQLMRLNEELRKAMGSGNSAGGNGLVGEIRAGSIGAPPQSKVHIGEATDPYAAAAAAEAAELGTA